MFYLLKSTHPTDKNEDILIELDKVESICFFHKKFNDSSTKCFGVFVNMDGGEHWTTIHDKIEDAKKVIQEITKMSMQEIDNFTPAD